MDLLEKAMQKKGKIILDDPEVIEQKKEEKAIDFVQLNKKA